MTDTFHTSLDRAAVKVLGEDLFADALKAKAVTHTLDEEREADRAAGMHYPADGRGWPNV